LSLRYGFTTVSLSLTLGGFAIFRLSNICQQIGEDSAAVKNVESFGIPPCHYKFGCFLLPPFATMIDHVQRDINGGNAR
jgi:hypothetical protein